MAAYVIADVTVKNPDLYAEYRKQVPATVEKYGGRFLVRGGAAEPLEGEWRPGRLVVIEFPDVAAAKAWYRSQEYGPLVALRHGDRTLAGSLDGLLAPFARLRVAMIHADEIARDEGASHVPAEKKRSQAGALERDRDDAGRRRRFRTQGPCNGKHRDGREVHQQMPGAWQSGTAGVACMLAPEQAGPVKPASGLPQGQSAEPREAQKASQRRQELHCSVRPGTLGAIRETDGSLGNHSTYAKQRPCGSRKIASHSWEDWGSMRGCWLCWG